MSPHDSLAERQLAEAKRQFQIANVLVKSMADEPDPPWISPAALRRLALGCHRRAKTDLERNSDRPS